MHPCGLITALDVLGVKDADLRTAGAGPLQGFIVRNGAEPIASGIVSEVRRFTSRQGCVLVERLVAWAQEEYGKGIDADAVHGLLDAHATVEWLGTEREWAWVPDVPRSRLFRPIRQVLAVVDEVSAGDLRAAIRRDLRMEGFAPPREVLVAILERLPWCSVSGDRVTLSSPSEKEALSGNAAILADVLQEAGGVQGRHELIDACVNRGMNLSTCLVLLLHSATVVPVSPHIFALIGAQVWPTDLKRLTPAGAKPRVLQDYGRTEKGKLWVSVRASVSVVTQGLVNVPGAFERYLQGEYVTQVTATGDPAAEELAAPARSSNLRVNHHMVTGLRDPLRSAGVDVGDIVVLLFAPVERTVEILVGDESLRFAYTE